MESAMLWYKEHSNDEPVGTMGSGFINVNAKMHMPATPACEMLWLAAYCTSPI
jgi:hypothetical protein